MENQDPSQIKYIAFIEKANSSSGFLTLKKDILERINGLDPKESYILLNIEFNDVLAYTDQLELAILKNKSHSEILNSNDGCIHEIEKYKNYVHEQMNEKLIAIENIENLKAIKKSKWLSSPSIFAFIFSELGDKGYIEMPKHNGRPNYSGYAKELFDIFEIDAKFDSFKREFSENSRSLSPEKRNQFKIPHSSALK